MQILLPWSQPTHFREGLDWMECLHVLQLAISLVECKFTRDPHCIVYGYNRIDYGCLKWHLWAIQYGYGGTHNCTVNRIYGVWTTLSKGG